MTTAADTTLEVNRVADEMLSYGAYTASQMLRALAAERDSLQAACRQWKEQFDAKDAALQQARASLTASDKLLREARGMMPEACACGDRGCNVMRDLEAEIDAHLEKANG